MFLYAIAQAANFQPDVISDKIKDIDTEYVVIQAWATFCEPCGEEVSELNKTLITVNKGKTKEKLKIIGVPVQSRKREIAAFIEHFKPSYEQLIVDSKVSEKFFNNNVSVPLTQLFAGKNRIKVKEWRGKITESDLLKEIETLEKNKQNYKENKETI
jgi:hypothetical protein